MSGVSTDRKHWICKQAIDSPLLPQPASCFEDSSVTPPPLRGMLADICRGWTCKIALSQKKAARDCRCREEKN